MTKLATLVLLTLLGIASFAPSTHAQTAVTYNADDLFLGFRASGGTGATQCYLVNLGQASQFSATGSVVTVPGLGNIAADLAAIFGTTWNTRSDLFWSISGTPGNFAPVGSDPLKTLYATRERTSPGTQSALWPRRSSTAQGTTGTKMNGLATAYTTDPITLGQRFSTANSPVAVIQAVAESNSYASYMPGGTVANSGPAPGTSFAAWNPTIEGSFANGTAGTVLDLMRMVPTPPTGNGDFLGTFTISDSGVLTFTPASSGTSSNADLASLLPSAGTLNPVFASGTLNYTASVSNATTSITLTPVVADATATVAVNGTAVTSGTASGPISLNVGLNNIPVAVTAQDGTIKTYTVGMTRLAPGTNANLFSLVSSGGALTPAFASGTFSYTQNVPNATSSVTLTPTVADSMATVTVNGTAVTSGTASGPISLSVGLTTITTVVTAQDGTTTQTYTLAVTRLSNNADLSNLSVSAGVVNPVFASATTSYTDLVSYPVTSLTITPVLADATATVKVNGTAVTSGTASGPISLNVGLNNIPVAVTAQDGTIKTYTVGVTRVAPSNNANLLTLVSSGGALTPAFASGTLSYTQSVPNATTSITLTPTVADATSTVTVNGTTVISGSTSGPIALKAGSNAINTVVTAQDGTTTLTYTLVVTRTLATGARLSNLIVSAGTLTPAFVSTTTVYSDNVPNTTTSMTVTPTVEVGGDTVAVNGTVVPSGTASQVLTLPVGLTTINVTVTAAVGGATNNYAVAVTRAAVPYSPNDLLLGFRASGGQGAGQDYVVNLGQASQFSATGSVVTVAGLGSIATDLAALFGPGWATRPDVFWSVSGTPGNSIGVGSDVAQTLYATQEEPVAGTPSALWNRSSGALQGVTSTAMTEMATAYTQGTVSTNSPVGVVQNATDAGSYASYQPGGTNSGGVPGTSFAAFNPTIEGTFTNGTTGTVLDLVRLAPSATSTVGDFVGKFTISGAGMVTFTPAGSANADLSALTSTAGTLTPVFAAGTTNYTASVPNATTSTTVTPAVADSNATVRVNGTTVASGAASGPISVAVGANPISIVVTPQNGAAVQAKTYTLTVTRGLSANANLASLAPSVGTLNPVFASGTLSYTASVPGATTSLTVTPAVADATATVTVNGAAVGSGSASGPISLNFGPNTISTVVTAQDGTTTKTYTLVVTRLSSNADLSNLSASAGTLTPAFAAATTSYTQSVPNATTSITLTPTVADATSTVTVNGTAVTSGTASGPISLNVGSNTITTVVTAADGATTKAYTLTVTRGPTANADLANLVSSGGVLTPAFASGTLSYVQSVPNATTSITLTPTVADATSTVTVNGTAAISGTASGPISLNVGSNTINIVVTSADGTATKGYTLTVTRGPIVNASLASLMSSGGALSPAFASGTLSYAQTVPNATTSITITPTLADPASTVTVNATAVTSGTASGPISLNVGPNTINTVVTAADGVTQQTYTLSVTRAEVGTADLVSLVASAGTLSPVFASGTTSYTAGVSIPTGSIKLTPTAADDKAIITVNGVIVSSGVPSKSIPVNTGANTIRVVVTARDHKTKTYTVTFIRANVPIVTVARPATGATVEGIAGVLAPVRGMATSNVGIAQVLVLLNGQQPPIAATLTPGEAAMDPVNWILPVTPQNGINKLEVKATDVFGDESAVQTVYFRYVAWRPELAGTYTGLATPTLASTIHPAQHVGVCRVSVLPTGAFTGTLTLGGSTKSVPLRATFGNEGDSRFGTNGAPMLQIKRSAGLSTVYLTLHVDGLKQEVTGTLTESENGPVVSTLVLNRQLYTNAKNAQLPLLNVPATVLNPSIERGRYTGIFQALSPADQGMDAADYPQGDGWAQMSVKPTGGVSLKGRLADGKPFSYSSYLSRDNVFPLYLTLYSGTGTLSGPVSFRDVPNQSDADGIALRWFKPLNLRDSTYRAGWPQGIKMDFLGSKFVSPLLTPMATRNTLLGNAPAAPPKANARLELSDGGLLSTLSNDLSVDGRNRVTVLEPSGGATVRSVTLFPSGKFTGSFTRPSSAKSAGFSGVLLQKTQSGSGYFIGAPAVGSPLESGAVTISVHY